MNLNVVDGFLECFEEDYGEAYSQCSRPFKRQAIKKGATKCALLLACESVDQEN